MNPPSKVWINGYSGRIGLELRKLIAAEPGRWDLIGGTTQNKLVNLKGSGKEEDWNALPPLLETADLIIDFSANAANTRLLTVLEKQGIRDQAVLIGTTGLLKEEELSWKKLAAELNLRLLLAPNTSLGILLTMKVSELLAQVLSPLHFDIEILETHHRSKRDAPSGTAKLLGENLAELLKVDTIYGREGKREQGEIGLASLRGGSVFGEHEVSFLGDNEEIRVSHRALNRQLFAQGALLLSQWLLAKKAGIYRPQDVSIEEMVQLLRKQNL